MSRLILYDFAKEAFDALGLLKGGDESFCALPMVKTCVGCFGCWLKTPGKCILDDRACEFPAQLARCDEFVVISKMTFGGLSSEAKAVLDRSIGYVMPLFRIVNGEMRHKLRYRRSHTTKYVFYGENITDLEKSAAERLVRTNSINFGSSAFSVTFCKAVGDVGAAL